MGVHWCNPIGDDCDDTDLAFKRRARSEHGDEKEKDINTKLIASTCDEGAEGEEEGDEIYGFAITEQQVQHQQLNKEMPKTKKRERAKKRKSLKTKSKRKALRLNVAAEPIEISSQNEIKNDTDPMTPIYGFVIGDQFDQTRINQKIKNGSNGKRKLNQNRNRKKKKKKHKPRNIPFPRATLRGSPTFKRR